MLLVLDLAFANIGWIIFDKGRYVASGVICSKPTTRKGTRVSDDFAHRCTDISDSLIRLVNQYKPQGIIAELPNGSQNAKAAKGLGAAIGLAAAIRVGTGLPLEWIDPGDSKEGTFGRRSASKEEVVTWAGLQYGTHIYAGYAAGKHEHIADAAMAYYSSRNGVLVKAFG